MPPQQPKWMRQRVRLSILVVCLGFAVLGLIKSRSNVFSAGSRASQSASGGCTVGSLPPVLDVHLTQLLALRASLLPMVASLGGQRELGGVTTAGRVWSGSPPQRLRLSRLPGGLWPGAYEMRLWGHGGDYIVADVLLFAHSGQARSYFEQFTSVSCHSATIRSPALRPPQARNLVSLDLPSFAGYQVLLTRGPLVYRVIDQRPRRAGVRPSNDEQSSGVSAVDALACTLAVAHCALETKRTS
jgi:hypothetical protein